MCVTILQFKFEESSKNLLYLYVLLANTLISRCCSAGKFYFSLFTSLIIKARNVQHQPDIFFFKYVNQLIRAL